MDTPWWTKGVGQEAADKLREVVKSSVPLRVASRPEDIAEVVTFLASPASRHMTGALVPVDAGFLLSVAVTPPGGHRD
jgi:3-oxoacyl-[acyl-carrier protein] reductase